jgi:thiol-disulfide isomerase/thioredoxin
MVKSFCTYGQKTTSKYTGMDYDSLIKAREEQATGKKFASFSAPYKNSVFSNDSLTGKTVFVNLWFAACPPCMAEMEALNELYDSLRTRSNFEFISFTYDPPEIIDSVVKLYNIKYKVLKVNQQDCYRLNQNNGFPTSLIVDGKGIIRYLNVGGYSEGEKVRQSIFDRYYPRLLKELQAAQGN